jgi:hypothetical protein
MKKRGEKIIFKGVTLFLIILSIGFSSANFNIGDESHLINTQYSSYDNIKGWINISFVNEPITSVFSDSKENSIRLIDLLEKNSDFEYNCTPKNCQIDYNANNPANQKEFTLEPKKSKLIGLKVTGKINEIYSVEFDLESDASSDCFNQLGIDILDDGEVDFKNSNVSEEICPFFKTYGCFDENKESTDFKIGEFPDKHCQRIKLTKSPGFRVGAFVNKDGDERRLKMAFYNLSGGEIEGANCILPSEEGEISCDIDYLIEESKDYYVCLYSDESEGDSTIKGYASSDKACGFYGEGIQNETASLKIFAEGKKFGEVGKINISNELAYDNKLGEVVKDYIKEYYKGLECPEEGCIVPIRITADKSQNIIVKNLEIEYQTNLGPITENNFYDLSKLPSKVNSNYQKLYFEGANFIVSSEKDSEKIDYVLNLGSEEILTQEITIGKIPRILRLTPLKTAPILTTKFEVTVDSPDSISFYEWKFGENNTITTTTNNVDYIYPRIGKYELTITIIDSDDKTNYAIFEIDVESPQGLINNTIKKMQEDLINVDKQLQGYDAFSRENLNSILNFSSFEDKLKKYQQDFANANSDEEYQNLLDGLRILDLPEGVILSSKADGISYLPSKKEIDFDILKSVGGGDYSSDEESKYVNSIFTWNRDNLKSEISFKEYSAKYASSQEPILRVFNLELTKKTDLEYNSYLFLKEIEGLEFLEDYGQEKESGYYYIEIEDDTTTITISTTEDISFNELPLFISPPISRLGITEGPEVTEQEPTSRIVIFILLIFLLVIFGLVFYIILQEWYKKKYENFLFKNRNYLFNLISYIENSKKKGVDDNTVFAQLKKAGWKPEQINYALKKYLGKRTGMFEIPIDKLIEKIKKKEPKPNVKTLPKPEEEKPEDKKI